MAEQPTLADKLQQTRTAKLNIKNALANKGVDVSTTPFTDYHTLIENMSSSEDWEWVRPADWLPLPENQPGVDKISLLVRVSDAKPDVIINIVKGTGFRIDWGDGTYDDYSGTVSPTHTYDTSTLPAMPSEGSSAKQVIVTITPHNGILSEFWTTYYSNWQHRPKAIEFVEARVNCSTLTQFKVSYVSNNNTGYKQNTSLKAVYIGQNSMSDLSQAFHRAGVLEYVKFEHGGTSTITDYYRAFRECWNLRRVDGLDISNAATRIPEIFFNASRLETVNGTGLGANINNLTYAFYNTKNLKRVFSNTDGEMVLRTSPTITQSSINLKQIARYNGRIEHLIIDFANNQVCSAQEAFREMYALRKVTSVNQLIFSLHQTLFYTCIALHDLSEFTPTLQHSDISHILYGTRVSEVPPWIDINSKTNLYRSFRTGNIKEFGTLTFSSDVNLFEFATTWDMIATPEIVLTNGATITDGKNLFAYMEALEWLRPLDVSKVMANFYGSFAHRKSLSRVDYYNIDKSMNFTNCNLSEAEINKIFTQVIAPATTGTLTFTGCPGAATCDPTPALALGWTVNV